MKRGGPLSGHPILEVLHDGVWILDSRNITTYVNSSILKMLGYSREEMVGKEPFCFLDQRNAGILRAQLEKREKGNPDSYEVEFTARDGRSVSVLLTCSPIVKKGRVIGKIGILKDVSERRKLSVLSDLTLMLTEELEIENLLQKIVDTAREIIPSELSAVYVLDEKEGRTQFFKASGCSINDVMPEGKGLFSVLSRGEKPIRLRDASSHPDFAGVPDWHPPIRSLLGAPLLKSDDFIGAILLANSRIGDEYSEADEKYLLVLAAKTTIAVVNSRLNDSMKKTNQELMRLGKFKDDLSYYLLHDLKNSLSGIIINIRFLHEYYAKEKLDEEANLAVNDSLNAALRVQQMIQDLLDVVRLEEGKLSLNLERFTPTELLEAQVKVLRASLNEMKKNLVLNIPESIPPVQGDKRLFQRVMSNLLDNAMKHTPEGGNIHILAAVHGSRNEVEFCVSNTGEEIPIELRDKVFDKFYRVEISKGMPLAGSGLGLSFCKMAVEAQKGRIWVDTPPQGGCRFVFTLPLSS